MDIGQFARLVRRNWAVLVVSALLGLIVGLIVGSGSTVQYSSTSEVLVTSPPVSSAQAYGNGLFEQQRAVSYASIAKGTTLATKVVDQLNLSVTPTELATQIQTSVEPNTSLVDITATDTTPAAAQRLCETVVNDLLALSQKIEKPTAAQAVVKMRIISSADLPTSPSTDKRLPDVLIGLVVGLFIGALLILLRAQFDRSVRDLHTVPELAGVPTLGSIARHPALAHGVAAASAPGVETYRLLAAGLHFDRARSGDQVVAITSARPHDGKTTIAVNVAVSAANAGERVLLIDANLRRPRVADALGLDASGPGLAGVLSGSSSFAEAITTHASSGVTVLPAGSMLLNPAGALQSERMHRLLQEARSYFDLIVVDTAPILLAADAVAVAGQSDSTLLVVRQERTTAAHLSSALQRLGVVETPLIGIVRNLTPREFTWGGDRYTPDADRAGARRGKRAAATR